MVEDARIAHMFETQYISTLFNRMAGEYDNLNDLWYKYTFAAIERVLIKYFSPGPKAGSGRIALDVGCGTGIQSLVLARLGYHVEGVDIADDLLAIARGKLPDHGFYDASFQHADAQNLPFPDNYVDCVNCCGPALSFVPDWRRALAEISRCLKPDGRLLLEVEGKWTLDMLWEIMNALLFNVFHYDTPLPRALRRFRPPFYKGQRIVYSFVLESGNRVAMPLRLFTAEELRRELEHVGLRVEKRWGLNVLTNLVPSTVLHRAYPGQLLRSIFHTLAAAERCVCGGWPFNALGCSLLVVARKKSGTR